MKTHVSVERFFFLEYKFSSCQRHLLAYRTSFLERFFSTLTTYSLSFSSFNVNICTSMYMFVRIQSTESLVYINQKSDGLYWKTFLNDHSPEHGSVQHWNIVNKVVEVFSIDQWNRVWQMHLSDFEISSYLSEKSLNFPWKIGRVVFVNSRRAWWANFWDTKQESKGGNKEFGNPGRREVYFTL